MPPEGEAPRDGMIDGSWSTAVKQFFGTSYEAYDSNNGYSASSSTGPISHVWFTGAKGILTEVMWPSIDTPPKWSG
jgi:glucoamylase